VLPLYKPLLERFRELLIQIGPAHTSTTLKSTIGIMHLLGMAIPLSKSQVDDTQARML
jgi:hypothetical protein